MQGEHADTKPVAARARPAASPLMLLVAAALLAVAVGGAALAAGKVGPGSWPSRHAGRVQVVDEVAVTPMNYEREFSSNSPLILAEPGEPRFVVMANRLDAPDFSCALQVSGDAGRTWLTANPVPDLPKGAEKCYAPEVSFDRRGTLYYLFVGLANPGNRPMGAFLVTSTDRGQTFSRPRRVLGPLNFSVRMAIDREVGEKGRIHLVWIATSSAPTLGGFGPGENPILTAYSDDGGKTISEPIQVSDPERRRVVAPNLAVGPDKRVHVAYYDLGRDAVDYQGLEGPPWDDPWTLILSSSIDGGRAFEHVAVDEEIIAPERVMLIFTMPPPALVVGSNGLVCAGWTDGRHGDPDALVRCSSDHGRTWRAVRRLNDDRVGNGASQYLPRLALSSEGRLDAVFFDRRDDSRNVLNRVVLTYSVDGGRSFLPNKRVSKGPSDSRIGQQYTHPAAAGQYEIGARLGLLSGVSHALVAWPDSRHWSPPATGQDLFSATVAMPERRGPGLVVRLLGGALAVAGLAGLVTWAVRSSWWRAKPGVTG